MIRTEINPAAVKIAQRLVAHEKGVPTVAAEDRFVTCRVCEKLRRPLLQLVGTAGVSSLYRRALALAKREVPALGEVEVVDDGSLVGLEGEAAAAGPVLIAHVIQLLLTFIGESLTLKLLEDIWPDLQDLSGSADKGGELPQRQT